eukprot:m.236615 g.236615  ORF g.236615 m.236615 type:complete len:93 (+) comp15785_c0_seq3:4000-4278(+)
MSASDFIVHHHVFSTVSIIQHFKDGMATYSPSPISLPQEEHTVPVSCLDILTAVNAADHINAPIETSEWTDARGRVVHATLPGVKALRRIRR